MGCGADFAHHLATLERPVTPRIPTATHEQLEAWGVEPEDAVFCALYRHSGGPHYVAGDFTWKLDDARQLSRSAIVAIWKPDPAHDGAYIWWAIPDDWPKREDPRVEVVAEELRAALGDLATEYVPVGDRRGIARAVLTALDAMEEPKSPPSARRRVSIPDLEDPT